MALGGLCVAGFFFVNPVFTVLLERALLTQLTAPSVLTGAALLLAGIAVVARL